MARLTVYRRSGQTALVAPQPSSRYSRALVADVLHRCELWTLLECHAVGQAARAAQRDLRPVRAVFPELNQQVLAPSNPATWHRLELQVHSAINRQAGNPLLAQLIDDNCRELQSIYARHLRSPIHRPGTLWLLQCQHRKIVGCIEAGQADEAVLHARAHLHLMRDQLLAALTRSGLR
jgi:DNA-binding GntR family transcriptional regulator